MRPMLIEGVGCVTDVIELSCWKPSAAVNDVTAVEVNKMTSLIHKFFLKFTD